LLENSGYFHTCGAPLMGVDLGNHVSAADWPLGGYVTLP